MVAITPIMDHSSLQMLLAEAGFTMTFAEQAAEHFGVSLSDAAEVISACHALHTLLRDAGEATL